MNFDGCNFLFTNSYATIEQGGTGSGGVEERKGFVSQVKVSLKKKRVAIDVTELWKWTVGNRPSIQCKMEGIMVIS